MPAPIRVTPNPNIAVNATAIAMRTHFRSMSFSRDFVWEEDGKDFS
jgi:hypothetical protein